MNRVKNDPSSIPEPKHFEKKTLANWAWAKDKAHRRKYDAVFDIDPIVLYNIILPSTNSIVSIIWWTNTSPNSNSPWPWPWPWPPWLLLWGTNY